MKSKEPSRNDDRKYRFSVIYLTKYEFLCRRNTNMGVPIYKKSLL